MVLDAVQAEAGWNPGPCMEKKKSPQVQGFIPGPA